MKTSISHATNSRRMAICHPDRPQMAKGLCNSCYLQKLRNEGRVSIRMATCHPDRKGQYKGGLCWSCHYALKRKENPEIERLRVRKAHLRYTYDISQEEFEKLLEKQRGVCASCGTDDWGPKGPIVDHSHETGHIRGILCFDCNLAAGYLRDEPDRCIRLARYLRKVK